MRGPGDNIVARKSYDFAIKCVNLYKFLCSEKHEFVLSKQMLRSGTSIGANIREGLQGQSKSDFIYKLNIALKEANETQYWLMLLQDTDYISKQEATRIIDDCIEIIKLLTSIINTAKNSLHN